MDDYLLENFRVYENKGKEMKKNITLLLTLLLISACSSEEPVKEEKVRGGEELFRKACGGCHNYENTFKRDDIPNMGEKKLIKLIEEYKIGAIKGSYGNLSLHEFAKKWSADHQELTNIIQTELERFSQKELKVLAKYIDQLNKGEVKLTPYEVSHKEELAKRAAFYKKQEALLVYHKRALQPLDKTTQEYKAFKKQKHRFVLNPCAMSYNEKPLWFGMSLEEVYEVLGKESHILYGAKYIWGEKGISLTVSNNRFIFLDIYLKKLNYHAVVQDMGENLKVSDSIILFNSILNPKEKMHEFLEKTNFTFNDFSFGERSRAYLLRYQCEEQKLSYSFESRIPFTDYGGIGHMSFNGPFMPKATHRVTKIQISRRGIK